MTYQEVRRYLESFINYEKIPVYPYKRSLKLKRIEDFLASIGNPQRALRCIHIAGTKGKGSTCAFIAYILRKAGFKVGLYTSPHLSDFRERIRILEHQDVRMPAHQSDDDFEGMISQGELLYLVKSLRPTIDRFCRSSKYGPLSFFEVYTVLAFVYFKEKKVDFVVLETGLGGRLDATNTADSLICVITPISYEHTQKLGNTLREIAMEKAGIIKNYRGIEMPEQRLIVISAPQKKEVQDVIQNRCKEIGAKLYEVGKDIIYIKNGSSFTVKGLFAEYKNLKTRLIGEHQMVNATAAIGAIEALRNYNVRVDMAQIKRGVANTVWPGRCEVISRNPLVVLDGAQNIASVLVLKKAIKENFRYRNLILVLGISKDKDTKGICRQLYSLADTVVLTKANNPRATAPKKLADYFKNKKIYITDNVKEAELVALKLAKKEDLVLVTGSLFVVGEFRNDKK